MQRTKWTETDSLTAVLVVGGFLMGMYIASYEGDDSSLGVGLALVVWTCVYGSFYFGRWHEARAIEAHIVKLTEQRDPAEDMANAVLDRLDRKATDSDRRRWTVTMLLVPIVFIGLSWSLFD